MADFNSDLKVLLERVDTMNKRAHRVTRYRNRLVRHIEKEQKKISQHIVWLLQDEHYHLKHNMLSGVFEKEAKELEDMTTGPRGSLKYSLEVLLHVIRHNRHLPLALDLFKRLPGEVQRQYKDQMEKIVKLFGIIEQKVLQVMPNIIKQGEALSQFRISSRIDLYVEYLKLYRESKIVFEEMFIELRPVVADLKKAGRKVKRALNKINNFANEHQAAIFVITLGLGLAAGGLTWLPCLGLRSRMVFSTLRVFLLNGKKALGLGSTLETGYGIMREHIGF